MTSTGPDWKVPMMAVLVFSVFSNLLMLTGPLFMLQVYDRVLTSRSEETLVALFALVAGLFALLAVFEFARARILARVGARLHSGLAADVMRAGLDRRAKARSDVPGSVEDLEAVRACLSAPVSLAVLDLPWTPVFLAAIFVFHPYLGWLAVAGGAVLIAGAAMAQAVSARALARASGLQLEAHAVARAAEDRAELIRAQAMQPEAIARFVAAQDAALAQAVKATDRTGAFASFTRAFRLFLQSAMLAMGAWLVLQGALSAGAMIAASILLGRALAPVDVVVGQWPMLQRARRGWRDLGALRAGLPADPPRTSLPRPRAELVLRDVSVLARAGKRPVLNAVTFALAPGQALGVIGRSGAGKSTLARVVAGLVPPTAGEVRLGGATLAQIGPESLGRHIGYLPQDLQVFDASVAENIARMEMSPDPGRVVAAARRARVHEVVLSLPDGYDTRIGPSDTQMSGGQLQRLALARALYGDPVLLVLDEPNSALDSDGSEALNAVIAEMCAADGAVLVMTHRPAAIAHCDRLLYLEGGRIAALGPREQVLRSMVANAGELRRPVRMEQRA